MAEGGVTPEEYSGSVNPDLATAAERSLYDSEVTQQAGELQHRVIKAIDQCRDIDPKKGEMYVKPHRKEKVEVLLTGFNKMFADPHGEGIRPDEFVVSTKEADRLAEFVRLANKIGSLNPDGSVTLNYRSKGSPESTVSMTFPPKRT